MVTTFIRHALAVNRARATGTPTVFWLDENRAHDANLISKVNEYLEDLDTDGLDLRIMAPKEATQFSGIVSAAARTPSR